jgi:hypothetical protein
MKSATGRAAEALDLMPEELREAAVAYLVRQAEKFGVLKTLVAEGMADVEAGRMSEWNLERFMGEARRGRPT